MSHPTTTLALLDALQEKWHQRFMALSAKDSEKRVGQAISEAANDLGDIIEAYESERLDPKEPADITEEPPVGSRLKDCQWHVWRRGERGWGIEGMIPGSNFDNSWSTVQRYAPLTALDEPAPTDGLPGEPVKPGDLRAGDRVAYTYRWKRYEGALVVTTMRRQPITTLEHAGLLVTFEGRWAGGISDVRLIERAPADVDPDEALAKVINAEVVRMARAGDVKIEADIGIAFERNLARVAREHIEKNQLYAYRPVAAERDKAVADLARVTKERDEAREDRALWEQQTDKARAERDALKAKADRYDSLRKDVERFWRNHRRDWTVMRGLGDALACDNERAES